MEVLKKLVPEKLRQGGVVQDPFSVDYFHYGGEGYNPLFIVTKVHQIFWEKHCMLWP